MGIRIDGNDEVGRKLDKLIKAVKKPYAPMKMSVAHLHNKMATYPPKRADSWYRRTGTLGRRWTHKVENEGKRGVVGNNTVYAPRVQSHIQQAWVHRGRWQTDKMVAEAELKTIIDFFRQAIIDETK